MVSLLLCKDTISCIHGRAAVGTVYVFEYNKTISDAELVKLRQSLDANRRKKFDACRRREDKLGCAAAYLLLCIALRREFGVIKFKMTGERFEKPALKGRDDIFFNLSHCAAGCACIVSKNSVGIDIQEQTDIPRGTDRLVCTERERSVLEKSDDPAADFIRMWTLKEAVLKMLGTGLSQDMKTVDTEELAQNAACRVLSGYTLAAASESREEDMKALLDNAVFINFDELMTEAESRTE